LRQTAKTSF